MTATSSSDGRHPVLFVGAGPGDPELITVKGQKALAGAELVIVCDRALSLGAAGPVLAEVRSAMYPLAERPHILGYTVGLGGRDVQPEAFEELVRLAQAEVKQGPSQEYYYYGVRG